MSAHRYRFFASYLGDGVWEVVDSDEVRHALQILRLAEGCEVEVADGEGMSGIGRLASPSKRAFRVVGADPSVTPASATPFAIAIGALKPGHIDELLPFLSEIGLDELHVFASEGAAKTRLGDKQLQRWQRIAMQSIKQCKRPRVLAITAYDSLSHLLAEEADRFAAKGVLDERGKSLVEGVYSTATLLLCGGEKGFSDSESRLILDHGFAPKSLGPYILQARHAVCAAAAVVAQMRPKN